MSSIDEEQCIAITNSGTRCKRVAKDGGFCFQHTESDETIDQNREGDSSVGNWLSSKLQSRATASSGVQRDIYANIADIQDGLRKSVEDFRSGNVSLQTLLRRFDETAGEVGGTRSRNTATGAVIGGIALSPLGPIGVWAGMTGGSTIAFFISGKDDRAIVGFQVEEPPENANIVSTDHPAIADIDPIQLVIQSAIENEDDDWLRETNTRAWDMDTVEKALSTVPKYEAEESPPAGHYVEDPTNGSIVVLIFGEPDEEFPVE